MSETSIKILEISSLEENPDSTITDTLTLTYHERFKRRFVYETDSGRSILLDSPQTVYLKDGDILSCSDGKTVQVIAKQERLLRIQASSTEDIIRFAWHLGNRHTPAELGIDFICIAYDHVLMYMLEGMGANTEEIHASFHPEQGAYHSH